MEKIPLTLVTPTSVIEPPRQLGKAGLALWTAIHEAYLIDDAAGVELLMQACGSADRVAELSEAISREGATVRIKGTPKAHPALRDELANRAFICRTLERLGLNLESVKPIGHPPKRY